MSMTNAQAALLAAASYAHPGIETAKLTDRAQELRAWLDAQDEPAKKQPVTQCTAESKMFATRCLLAAGHADEHRNSREGIHWTDEEHVHAHKLSEGGKVDAPVHFVGSQVAEFTACGMPMQYGMQATTDVDFGFAKVTCKVCRKDLGL